MKESLLVRAKNNAAISRALPDILAVANINPSGKKENSKRRKDFRQPGLPRI